MRRLYFLSVLDPMLRLGGTILVHDVGDGKVGLLPVLDLWAQLV